MAWTSEDTKGLQSFKYITDSDDVRFKQIIKETLLNNRFLIHVLNNKELEEEEEEKARKKNRRPS